MKKLLLLLMVVLSSFILIGQNTKAERNSVTTEYVDTLDVQKEVNISSNINTFFEGTYKYIKVKYLGLMVSGTLILSIIILLIKSIIKFKREQKDNRHNNTGNSS